MSCHRAWRWLRVDVAGPVRPLCFTGVVERRVGLGKTVSMRSGAGAAPVLLVTNSYPHGRLIRQALADGRAYTYAYTPDQGSPVLRVHIVRPEGDSEDLTFGLNGGAALHRHSAAWEAASHPQTAIY